MRLFEIGKYYDQDTGKTRWAVCSKSTNTWYFANRYGKKAAERLARRLNKEI